MDNKVICRYIIKLYEREIPSKNSWSKPLEIYAEVHRVFESENERTIGPGIPLSQAFFREIMNIDAAGSKKNITAGLIPEELLYHGTINNNEVIMWYKKAEKRYISTNHNGMKENLFVSEIYPTPPLLFRVVNRKNISVYALKFSQRPRLNTPLYHPPFPNIYMSLNKETNICFGTVSVNIDITDSIREVMDKVETYWWKSDFGQYLSHSSKNRAKDWVTAKKKGKFPINSLIPTNLCLKNLLENI